MAAQTTMAAAETTKDASKEAARMRSLEKRIVKLRPFSTRQVRLTDPRLLRQQEANREYLMSLAPDRLLHVFRLNAGLPTSAKPLGGWEKPDAEVRGHFVGHYLSALALMYEATGDTALRDRAAMMVQELAMVQDALGGGYLSAFPTEFFDRVEKGVKVWAPYYTIHKVMQGLLDVHRLCGDEQALKVVEGMAAYFKGRFDRLDPAGVEVVLRTEYGGINEVLYDLYSLTGNPAHRELAKAFDDEPLYEPLAQGKDILGGKHANSTIPPVIGAARRYEVSGEDRYRDVSGFFWRTVTGGRCYATGGTSNGEHWQGEPGHLADHLSVGAAESCCTFNMLRLTRRLMTWDPDPAYGDYYERAWLNGVLSVQLPEDGMLMYYMPLDSGWWKMFSEPETAFWCCVGTGVESFSKLADSIYFQSDGGLYVNLFAASTLDWREKGVRLTQETRFPDEPGTVLTLNVDKPSRFPIRIRVPGWAGEGAAVSVNGKMMAPPKPGTWFTISRIWKTGDRVEVRVPMSLGLWRMPDDPNVAAVMYGPVVLAGELGTEGLTPDMFHGWLAGQPKASKDGKPLAVEPLRGNPDDLSLWMDPVEGKPLSFRVQGQSKPLTLSPLYRLNDQRYAVYWKLQPPQ